MENTIAIGGGCSKEKKRKNATSSGEGSATHLDFDNAELTEVLGADKRNRTRGISSNLSTKQLKHTSIAKVMLAQARSSSNFEFKGEMSEMKSSIARVEGVLMDMLKLVTNNGMSNSQPPRGDTTPGTDVGSNSVRRSSQQNLMNMFESGNPPVNPPVNPPANPPANPPTNPPAETLSPPLKVSLRKVREVNCEGPYIGLITVYPPEEKAFFATKAFQPHPSYPFIDLSGCRFRVGKIQDKSVIYVRCGVGTERGKAEKGSDVTAEKVVVAVKASMKEIREPALV
ncbi:hypothetical protein IFM89_008520 [Coptis chinensis]|uniref:Uncharacterized protein n=1 Tax=Coptis chinensis TaxID=261450 RepID=A0A835HL57_9MAGN|nr:hypothetical protein IFM89_008520 [Coptis chinensis]